MIGQYETQRFPAFRNPTIDTLDIGIRKHHIPFLFDNVDVSIIVERATLRFDHDVTDGARVARFVQRLVQLLEQGYGIELE
jgi:hypothetical protein